MLSLKRGDEREVLNLAGRRLLNILNQHTHQENSGSLFSLSFYEDLFYMAIQYNRNIELIFV